MCRRVAKSPTADTIKIKTMADKRIVAGILSYGMSGQVFHAPFLDQKTRFELRAVVERTHKRAHERYPEIISYDSVEALLDDEAIELVVVNTPNDTHFEYACKALEAGKHILVEKPFATSSAEAKAIFDLGRKVGKHVMVFQNRRWDSDFKLVKRIIEQGVLGDLIEFHVRFDRYRPEKSHKIFKETSTRAGSGVLYDLGPHMLDQVLSLLGRPDHSMKITKTHRPDSEVDDFASLILQYKTGPVVFIHANLLVANPMPAYVLHGSKGSFQKDRTDVQETQLLAGMLPKDAGYGVEPPGKEGLLDRVEENGEIEMKYQQALKGDYNGLFNAVYAQIQRNEPFPITEEEIIWQMEILEQTGWGV